MRGSLMLPNSISEEKLKIDWNWKLKKIYKPGRSGAGCSALDPSLLYFWAFGLLCLCFFELSAFGLLGLWALGPFEDNFMKQIPGYPSNSLPVIHISRDLARKMAEWLGTFFSWLIRSPFPWGDTKKWPLESTYLAIAFGWCQGVFILMRKKVRFALEVNQACWSNWNIASTKVSFFWD